MTDQLSVEKIIKKKERSDGTRLQVWHLVLSVIGVILALSVQSGTAIWWAATISSDVRNEKLARSADKRAQKEVDKGQDDLIRRQEDQRREEQKVILEKLDWIMKNMPRR